ncbi:AlbA family DNA-binding domain-containing protein [Pseudoduganella rivuli]|nr:ATP-binding protein [Pseudoduganella rivuli]
MIPNDFQAISELDLQRLVDSGIPENLTLEYKRALPSGQGEEKYDLLADWTAMANTEGGDILYGVAEDKGLPIELVGLEIPDPDQLKQSLLNKIRDGSEPQLAGIQIRSIPLSSGKSILLVRIARSWNAPHRVVLSKHGHFYARNAAGNYQLDVAGLKSAFVASENIGNRVAEFVADRLARLGANRGPVHMEDIGLMVLHLVPLSAFSLPGHVRLGLTKTSVAEFRMFGTVLGQSRFNIDGAVVSDGAPTGNYSYTQVFRHGAVESVMACVSPPNEPKTLYGKYMVNEIVSSVGNFKNCLARLNVQPPFVVSLAFLNVKGYRLLTGSMYDAINRDVLPDDSVLLPDILIQAEDFAAHTALRPLFDVLWNTFGKEACPYYAADGTLNANA